MRNPDQRKNWTEGFFAETTGCIFPFGLEMKMEIPACDLEGLSWPTSMGG
jgi:hypothetical protein